MIDAKVLSALKGYSNNKSHFRIQTFTVFLRGKWTLILTFDKNVLQLNCNNSLHFSYRSISVDKIVEIVIIHIEVLSLINGGGRGVARWLNSIHRWLRNTCSKTVVFTFITSLNYSPQASSAVSRSTWSLFFPPFYFLWSYCFALISRVFNILPQSSSFPDSVRIFGFYYHCLPLQTLNDFWCDYPTNITPHCHASINVL